MNSKLLIAFLITGLCYAQDASHSETTVAINPLIDGTLLVPNDETPPPLAIIIAGSGPTYRNGNQNMMKNNAYRLLAEGLAAEGIATFRYDKRIVKQLRNRTMNEEGIRFDDFIEDAKNVAEIADGVVVGSSIVKLIEEKNSLDCVFKYIETLANAVHGK